MTDILKTLESKIKEHDVVLFMKGSPDFPHCGFSAQVAAILKELGLDFHYLDILQNPDVRQSLPEYSHWPTYPQLFIRGELVGGCDIVVEAYQEGELATLIADNNLSCQSLFQPLDLGR